MTAISSEVEVTETSPTLWETVQSKYSDIKARMPAVTAKVESYAKDHPLESTGLLSLASFVFSPLDNDAYGEFIFHGLITGIGVAFAKSYAKDLGSLNDKAIEVISKQDIGKEEVKKSFEKLMRNKDKLDSTISFFGNLTPGDFTAGFRRGVYLTVASLATRVVFSERSLVRLVGYVVPFLNGNYSAHKYAWPFIQKARSSVNIKIKE